VIYGFFTPRAQAILDLTLLHPVLHPGIVALTYAGYFYASESWRSTSIRHHRRRPAGLYPFKTVIPLAGAFVLVQGIVEIIAGHLHQAGRVAFARTDVQEVDVEN